MNVNECFFKWFVILESIMTFNGVSHLLKIWIHTCAVFAVIKAMPSGLVYDLNLFGDHFMLVFNNASTVNETTLLRVANAKAGQVYISVMNFTNPFSYPHNTSLDIPIHSLCTGPAGLGEDCVVFINSTSAIGVVVNGRDGRPFYTSIPTSKLEIDYLTETSMFHGQRVCSIVTTQPWTKFSFNLQGKSVSFVGKHYHCHGNECLLEINARFSILKLTSSGDFTGVLIHGDKPFALFCGGPTRPDNSSIMLNQILPIGMYGVTYVTWHTFFDGFVSVMPSCNHTEITIYGLQNQTFHDVQAGSSMEHFVSSGHRVMVYSDKPVMAMQSWTQVGVGKQKVTLLPLVSPNVTCHDDVFSTQLFSSVIETTVYSLPFETATPSDTADLQSTASYCQCPCKSQPRIGSVELAAKLEKLTRDTRLDKANLSRFLRKRTSATDNRPSAKGIGILGTAVLFGTAVLIVIIDSPNLMALIHNMNYFKHQRNKSKIHQFITGFQWKRSTKRRPPESDPSLTIVDYEDEFQLCGK